MGRASALLCYDSHGSGMKIGYFAVQNRKVVKWYITSACMA